MAWNKKPGQKIAGKNPEKYTIIYEPPIPHYCSKPFVFESRIGTIVKCNECEKYWQLIKDNSAKKWIVIDCYVAKGRQYDDNARI